MFVCCLNGLCAAGPHDLFFRTLRAYSVKKRGMSENFEVGDDGCFINRFVLSVKDIANATALYTEHMVVRAGVSVKAFLASRGADNLDEVVRAEHLEIPVYRAQADFGKFLTNHVVDLVGRGVTGYLAQFFQDNLSLFGKPTRGRGG